jgi:hypothetical protein
VRIGAWSGEAPVPDGLVPGTIAHGIPRKTHTITA